MIWLIERFIPKNIPQRRKEEVKLSRVSAPPPLPPASLTQFVEKQCFSHLTKSWSQDDIWFLLLSLKSTHEWLHPVGDDLSDIITQKNKADIKNHLQPIVEHYPDFRWAPRPSKTFYMIEPVLTEAATLLKEIQEKCINLSTGTQVLETDGKFLPDRSVFDVSWRSRMDDWRSDGFLMFFVGCQHIWFWYDWRNI